MTPAIEPTDATRPAPSPPLVAVGCSAGSLPVLIDLVRGLPKDLGAAVLICQHTSQHGTSTLPGILSRDSALPANWAADGDRLVAGRVYVAPPGHHLLVNNGEARLSSGPRVNRHRPSVDVLFTSVAAAAGPAATVVVLSGVLDDGAVGSALVEEAGGQVLVQDPETAQFSAMPRAALKAAATATVMQYSPGDEVVRAVARAAGREAAGTAMDDENNAWLGEYDRAHEHNPRARQDKAAGAAFLHPDESHPVRLVCPDCGGALAQVDLPSVSYFRCHVGHQYGPESLVAAMADNREAKLWSAVAALEEEAMLQAYVEDSQPVASAGEDLPGPSPDRARDLWGRAAELRELVQRWTQVDAHPAEPSSDQSRSEEPS